MKKLGEREYPVGSIHTVGCLSFKLKLTVGEMKSNGKLDLGVIFSFSPDNSVTL